METSIVDLRYKTNAILAALDNNENVVVLYNGKPKALITPIPHKNQAKITQHPFFNMRADDEKTVLDELNSLRARRYDL